MLNKLFEALKQIERELVLIDDIEKKEIYLAQLKAEIAFLESEKARIRAKYARLFQYGATENDNS